MKSEDNNRPVEVFAGTVWDAGLVRSMLEDRGIETFLQDEIRGNMVPWHITAGGAGAVKLIVSNVDFEKAKQVVDEYYQNINKV